MTLDNLDRVSLTDPLAFYRDYVRASRPVVIRDFLAPDALARVRELGGASTQPMFPRTFAAARVFDEQRLGELLAEIETPTVWMHTPEGVRAIMRERLAGLPFEDDSTSELWAGRVGGQTDLHFDLDMRANVLVQLYGHKRVTLADPDQTQKLEPNLHGDRPQFSSRMLDAYGDDDRRRFLAFLNARETVLAPGEALFIPALYWHELDYLDTTLSITLRLGREPALARLAATIPRLWPAEIALVQGIAARCVGRDEPHPRLAELRAAFDAACTRDDDNARFVEVLRAVHAELCPGRLARPFCEHDAAYFETRTARRPEIPADSEWNGASVPWLAPGYEVVEVLDADQSAEFRVLSCARSVIARFSVPADVGGEIREVLRRVACRKASTIDELADEVGLDGEQLTELITSWARHDWIVPGR